MPESARERVTVQQAAEGFAALIGKRADALMAQLKDVWPENEAPGRMNTLEFVVECLFFQAFPIDVVVAKEFGAQSEAIREGMSHRLFEALRNQFIEPADRHHFEEPDFGELLAERFAEYADAWKHPKGSKTWAENVADLAWRRIAACEPTLLTTQILLVADLTASFKSFAGVGARFEVVAG
jgi:hypothetical protein